MFTRTLSARALAAAGASSALMFSAVAPVASAQPTPAPTPEVEWQDCREGYFDFMLWIAETEIPEDVRPDLSTLGCGSLDVPLDHSGRTEGRTKVSMIKVPATEEKKGTLFVNPGGPGGSASLFALMARPHLAEDVWKHYDIVGVDPRGAGAYNSIDCTLTLHGEDELLELEKTMDAAPYFPYKQGDFVAFRKANALVTKACATSPNPGANFMTTADVARDMDFARQALGEDQLNYFGVSYGSYLGATYANLFPHNVRSMVVDSSIDANAYAGTDLGNAVRHNTWERIGGHLGQQAIMERIARDCAAAGRCESAEALLTSHKEAADALRKEPVVGTIEFGGETFEAVVDYTAYFGLLSGLMRGGTPGLEGIPAFIESVKAASEQDGDARVLPEQPAVVRKALHQLHHTSTTKEPVQVLGAFAPGSKAARAQSLYAEKQQASAGSRSSMRDDEPGGTPPEGGDDTFIVSFLFWDFTNVVCTDSVNSPSLDTWAARAKQLDKEVPGFGPMWTSAVEACPSWPFRGENVYRGPFTKTVPGGTLVLNYTHDPATPVEGARRLHDTLANSRMVTVDGYGHGAAAGSSCAREIAGTYITTGALPEADAKCVADELPFAK